MRYHNGEMIEILAPVSVFSDAKEILNSKCDAIYLGGKNFNMRMHSSKLNFTNEEIKEVVKMAHELNKFVYVTLNVWIDDTEIKELIEYLKKLEAIKIDAVIIQDIGILQIIKDEKININIHSSVMMNIHNKEELKLLKEFGVTRFVASRDMQLTDIYELNKEANLETEYFVSGDICCCHGGTCYSSTILLNRSSNKGQCFKMCRWEYELGHGGKKYPQKYYLAAKDIDLLDHVEELIENKINSFKIEGRRKPAKDIIKIVDLYATVVDTYLDNKKIDIKKLKLEANNSYLRDTTSAHAMKNPQLEMINMKNENKHRVFSKSSREILINEKLITELKELLVEKNSDKNKKLELSVKVQSFDQAMIAIKNEVAYIYLSLEALNEKIMSVEKINRIIDNKKNSKIYLSLPQMCFKETDDLIDQMLSVIKNLDGIVVSNLGQIEKYKNDYDIKTNLNFKVTNKAIVKLLKSMGVSSQMISLEATYKQLNNLLPLDFQSEMYVYGQPTMMYSELNYYLNLEVEEAIEEYENKKFDNDILVLIDKIGNEHPVYLDNFNKSHILTTNNYNLLVIIKELVDCGLSIAMIDGRLENQEDLNSIIKEYKKAISNLEEFNYEDTAFYNKEYILGALSHYKENKKFVIN